jgi:hypothetical protein
MKALFVAFLLAAAASTAHAAVTGTQQDVLRGLSTVDLLVEHMNGDAIHAGFEPAEYAQDAAQRLHEAGIHVRRTDSPDDSASIPCLYLRVSAMVQPEEHLAVYSVGLEMFEQVHVTRVPDVYALGSIWRAHERIGKLDTDHLAAVRDKVKDEVDEFIDAWLAANDRQAAVNTTSKTSVDHH